MLFFKIAISDIHPLHQHKITSLLCTHNSLPANATIIICLYSLHFFADNGYLCRLDGLPQFVLPGAWESCGGF